MSAASEKSEKKAAAKAERCAAAKCPLAGQGDERCGKCTGPVVWTDANGRHYGKARRCTSCPMDGLGLPVCWAACPGPSQGFCTDGQTMIALGQIPDPDGFVGANISFDAMQARQSTADFHTRLTPDAEAAVMELVRIFVGMSAVEVATLHAMVKGGTITRAAELRGVKKQAVHAYAVRIARKFPQLRRFFFRRATA